VQEILHQCPGIVGGLLQWYGLLFFGFCMLMLQTYYTNMLLLRSYWLSTAMPTSVRIVSKASLVAGILGFVLLFTHFAYSSFAGKMWRERNMQLYPWALSKRQDMLFCLLSVPALYISMSVQSTARMWMVISGAYGEYGKDVDLDLYQENLDLCSAFGYWGVYAFSRLCWKFIKERTSTDIRHVVKFASFQGVGAFVLVGVVKSVLSFGMAYSTRHYPGFMEQNGELLEKGYAKINDALVVITIICIYNMILICNFEPIQDALGNATAKFFGLRVLMLLQQIQPMVLKNSAVMAYFCTPHSCKNTEDTENIGKLLHSSLLTLECVLVILFNFLSWEFGSRRKELLYDARVLAQRRRDAVGYDDMRQPLNGA